VKNIKSQANGTIARYVVHLTPLNSLIEPRNIDSPDASSAQWFAKQIDSIVKSFNLENKPVE
jgi:hypothetical protein